MCRRRCRAMCTVRTRTYTQTGSSPRPLLLRDIRQCRYKPRRFESKSPGRRSFDIAIGRWYNTRLETTNAHGTYCILQIGTTVKIKCWRRLYFGKIVVCCQYKFRQPFNCFQWSKWYADCHVLVVAMHIWHIINARYT